jgi:hypothetical protein
MRLFAYCVVSWSASGEKVVDDAQQRCGQIRGYLLGPCTAQEHRLEEPGRRWDVVPLGHVHVDDLAVLVDGAVHVPPHTGDADVSLIDEPTVTDTVSARPCRLDDERGESLHPPVDRHVVDLDATFGEQFFDIAV